MSKQLLRPIGVLFVGGLAGGLAITLLNLGDDAYSMVTPLFYGVAGGVGGITWVLLGRYLKLTKRTAEYFLTTVVSAIVAGLVLLQFGYSITGAVTSPDLNEHIATAVGFGVGGLVFGLLEWKFNVFSSREPS